jgi:peptide/nickel transport system permease protein
MKVGAIEPLPARYLDTAPFDPARRDALTPEQERFYTASQWRLIWWRFRRHPIAVVSAVLLALCYASILVSELIAPYNLHTRDPKHIYAPPQGVHLFHDGKLVGPFVYGYTQKLDMQTLRRLYTADPTKVQPLRFFCRGDPYLLWGKIKGDFHFVCPAKGGSFFLLGTDRLGRDVFSRITHGARISLTVGLLGITVSFVLGVFLGGISGYYGGWTDTIIQRLIEIVRSFPMIPLWLSLSAVLPVTWDPLWVFFGITLILGLVEWSGIAWAV